ncbi:hypothetical protein AB0B66_22465 [Catellatospora sp. NPDC049111]|uniref:hypothetical protein n=1 Tax=Catellatospora sp. NPDC049111 TaxID=3155271 RepID=UPI0033EDDA05
MRPRAVAAAIALGLGLAGSVLAASPAAAAVDRSCYADTFCVYKDADFSTSSPMYRFTKGTSDWAVSTPEIFEADSSWRNLRSSGAATYTSFQYFGQEICVDGGYQVASYYWANNDGASSKVNVTC